MRLSLSRLRANEPTWLGDDLIDALSRVAAGLEPQETTVEIVIVDDSYIQRINREYRGQNRPTDVISFSYLDVSPAGDRDERVAPAVDGGLLDDEVVAGEIYISQDTLEREASTQGMELKHLFLRIGVHGLLHVVGYDHEEPGEAARMEGEERRILMDLLSPRQVEELF